VLSDSKVIEELNRAFVPMEINITQSGIPLKAAPGLWPWTLAYAAIPNFEKGFVSTVVLDPTGKRAIHDGGDSGVDKVATAANYNPPVFLEFLAESLRRHKAKK
jgi:hypothetical protein